MFAAGKTKGASNGSSSANYIEDVFSTYLYTGNGSTQTITNGIDTSTKGGLVWMKSRSASYSHALFDTARGGTSVIATDSSDAANPFGSISGITFNSNGFYLPDNNSYGWTNTNNVTYASWTFRKQPKFFDVVTYTGTGSAPRNISHNLGSVPACIMIKRTDSTGTWTVYHVGTGNTKALFLNADSAADTNSAYWNNTTPTSTVFTLGGTFGDINANGATYVAYLFAHNAGGFGLTGTDNVISCGSFTTDGSGVATVDLGYEPQYLMWKASSQAGNWLVLDNMRGWTNGGNDSLLRPNTSDAESTGGQYGNPTATGFYMQNMAASATYIYIAIRRGPMKVPTDATKVFSPVAYTGNGSTRTYSVGFPTDISINMNRSGAGDSPTWNDRLRGSGIDLYSNGASAESNNGSAGVQFDNQTNIVVPSYRITSSTPYIDWCMRRAPSFFDEVCYTGTGVRPLQLNHNLGAVPELMIVKNRTNAYDWFVYSAALGNTNYLRLNTTAAVATSSSAWSDTTPTSTTFTVGDFDNVNGSTGFKYVAYLFATAAGVSKVGSYTGNGSSQTINCGFTGGARFVLIKRTDSTGGWYVYDTARGMTVLTDPYLLLNSSAAEVATLGSVTTVSTGFAVNASILAAINTNAATYLFLAIA